MNTLQRTIKYIATGFAIFLSVVIITSIVGVVIMVINIFSGSSIRSETLRDLEQTYSNVENITIDGSYYDVEIREGEQVSVVMSNVSDQYEVKQKGNTLSLQNENSFFLFHLNWFGEKSHDGKIILYLPVDFIGRTVKLEGGMGNISIDSLNARHLEVNGGMGNITGSNISAEEFNCDGGMGNVELTSVSLGKSDLDGGAGNINLTGAINGNCEIDGGLGNIDLTLEGSSNDFNVNTNSGLGSIIINNEDWKSSTRNNSYADKSLEIDGGMGDVSIDFTLGN